MADKLSYAASRQARRDDDDQWAARMLPELMARSKRMKQQGGQLTVTRQLALMMERGKPGAEEALLIAGARLID